MRSAFRPDAQDCELRAVARQRDILLTAQASWVRRTQLALVQMNIQPTEMLSGVMGQTGALTIRAIVAGERGPKALAHHRHSRIKASIEDIIKALSRATTLGFGHLSGCGSLKTGLRVFCFL